MDLRRAVASGCSLAAGPLAMVGFFLPWADGPGVLSSTTFSGFSLVRFTGHLRQLDLSLAQGGLLWLVRLAILAVPIAAAWQAALAPRLRWHVAYTWSGWYLVAFACVALAMGLWRVGLTGPPSGLALIAAAALCFVAGQLAGHRLDEAGSAAPFAR
ncbi:MAG: hypothetical protein ACKVT1_06180 [Dehalococcoidia bacterium]